MNKEMSKHPDSILNIFIVVYKVLLNKAEKEGEIAQC